MKYENEMEKSVMGDFVFTSITYGVTIYGDTEEEVINKMSDTMGIKKEYIYVEDEINQYNDYLPYYKNYKNVYSLIKENKIIGVIGSKKNGIELIPTHYYIEKLKLLSKKILFFVCVALLYTAIMFLLELAVCSLANKPFGSYAIQLGIIPTAIIIISVIAVYKDIFKK